jgi:hypothetical protein
MAKAPVNTQANDTEEWTEVNRGLGLAVIFDQKGDEFVGYFVGAKEGIETDDKFHPGKKRMSTALQFNPIEDPDTLCFIWQNGVLENAFEGIQLGEKVRIVYDGIENYTDKETQQPRNTKRYRVMVAGRK